MSAHAIAESLKQRIPLLDYLRSQDWQPTRRIARGRLMGVCPLHADRKPSFLVDPGRSLFYCYGCGRGGDVIRFVELTESVSFGEAITLLRRWSGMGSLLSDVIQFYQVQLHRHPEAVAYLAQRGVRQAELIEHMRIGYAPGRCLFLADEPRLFAPRSAASRRCHIGRPGYVCPSHRLSARLEPLRTQHR